MTSTIGRHGSDTTYDKRGCRCGPCTAAHTARVARTRARAAKRLSPDDPRHGTRNAYDNLGCRCQKCKVAKAVAHRDYYVRSVVGK